MRKRDERGVRYTVSCGGGNVIRNGANEEIDRTREGGERAVRGKWTGRSDGNASDNGGHCFSKNIGALLTV